MTTRVQEKPCLQELWKEPRMQSLEKGMLRLAVFDPADKVLDANVCSGQVAEYLLRNMDCQVCGVSDRMEEVRQTRARMYGGDFVYAARGDIPWQDNTFDTVLLHPTEGGLDGLKEQLPECKRVLKAGGQLVLGLRCVPTALRRLSQLVLDTVDEEEPITLEAATQALASLGFEQPTRMRVGCTGHVIIAWKAKEA